MPRCRVVRPGLTRLPLSGGDWVEVRRELNAGEYFDLLLAMSERQSFAKLLAYMDRHERDEETALDAKKNAPSSDSASSRILQSVG